MILLCSLRHLALVALTFAMAATWPAHNAGAEAASGVASQQGASQGVLRRHPVPGLGSLELEVPGEWQEAVRPAGFRITVEYRGSRAEEFLLLVSVLGSEDFAGAVVDEALLRLVLGDRLNSVRQQAVEKDLRPLDLTCAAGRGSYFTMTDAEHKPGKPGDYRYMTQGGCMVDGAAIYFTLLDNTADPGRLRQTLHAITTARLVTPAMVARSAPPDAAGCTAELQEASGETSAEALIRKGLEAERAGRHAEAEGHLRHALALAQRSEGVQSPTAAYAAAMLAQSLSNLGRHAEAAGCQRRALTALERPDGPSAQQLAPLRCRLAHALWRAGWHAEAGGEIERLAGAVTGKEGRLLGAQCRLELANALGKEGALADSERLFRDSLAILEQIDDGRPEISLQAAMAASGLSGVLLARGNAAETEQYARRSLPVLERAFPPGHRAVGVALQNLCVALTAQERFADAESHCRRSQAQVEGMWLPDPADLCKSSYALAVCLFRQGRAADAEPVARKALTACDQASGSDGALAAAARRLLGGVLAALGRFAEAEPVLRRALDACVAGGPERIGVVNELARVLRALDRTGDAAELERREGLNKD